MMKSPASAERLIAAKEEILRRWETTLRQLDPTFDEQPRTPLRDDFPEYLSQIATRLAQGRERGARVTARAHGIQRTRLRDYSLTQIIQEYRVLRSTIFSVLEDGDCELDDAVRQKISACIDDGITEAVEAFAETYMGREKMAATHRQQLLEIVSHDLRGPLQAILTAVSLVTRIVTDERVTPHLRQIARAARTAAVLTRNLVDVAQIEAGGLAVRTDPHEIGALRHPRLFHPPAGGSLSVLVV